MSLSLWLLQNIPVLGNILKPLMDFIKLFIPDVGELIAKTMSYVGQWIWNVVMQPLRGAVTWMIDTVKGIVVEPAKALVRNAVAFVQKKMFGTLYIVLLVKLMQKQVVDFVEKPSIGKLAMIIAKPFVLYLALAIGWNMIISMLSSMNMYWTVGSVPVSPSVPPHAPPPPGIPTEVKPPAATELPEHVFTVHSIEPSGLAIGGTAKAHDSVWSVHSVDRAAVPARKEVYGWLSDGVRSSGAVDKHGAPSSVSIGSFVFSTTLVEHLSSMLKELYSNVFTSIDVSAAAPSISETKSYVWTVHSAELSGMPSGLKLADKVSCSIEVCP